MADQRKILRSIGARLMCVGLASSIYAGSVLAEDSEVIEEVIVTGSYIKGVREDAPSPVKVIDRDQMLLEGNATLYDMIRNLSVNSGSIANTESGGIGNDLIGTTNVNLRGLGANSTLVLINGKRLAPTASSTNAGEEVVDTSTIPSIMTQRVEILLDGGSALYGSDAVAGVFNIVMRNDYEGFEIEAQLGGMTEAIDAGNERVAAIFGFTTEDGKTNFVISGETYRQDEVDVSKAKYFDEDLPQYNSIIGSVVRTVEGFGGESFNPAWDNVLLTEQAVANGGGNFRRNTDPNCLDAGVFDADGTPFFVDTQFNDPRNPDPICREDVSEYRMITIKYETYKIAGSVTHRFNDSLEAYGFFNYADSTAYVPHDGTLYSPYAAFFLPQPGTYANDEFGRAGLGTPMELGYFADQVIREGRAPLARPGEMLNHPGRSDNGGMNIAMNASIFTGYPRTRAGDRNNEQRATTVQAGLRGDFTFADREFDYDVGLTWSENSLEYSSTHWNRRNAELAVNGLGGPNCVPNGVEDFDFRAPRNPDRLIHEGDSPWDYLGFENSESSFESVNNLHESLSLALTSNNQGVGDCQFFNPYISSIAFDNPDYDDVRNSDELLDWMSHETTTTDRRNKLAVFDGVVSGELFEMRGGDAQFALGAQYRRENRHSRKSDLMDPEQLAFVGAIKSFNNDGPTLNDAGEIIRASGTVNERYDYINNSYNCDRCSFGYDSVRTVSSVFLELSLPFWENIESQVAVRWEDYGGGIGESVTPKVAMSWRPINTLMFRGSFSKSFRAPNIGIVQQGLPSVGLPIRDPFRVQAVRAGLLEPTDENARDSGAYMVGGPAPDLGPEEANTYSLGFQWEPEELFGVDLNGLSVGMTLWRFEYSDRVSRQPAAQSLDKEIAAFLIARDVRGADGTLSNYILNHTLQPFGLGQDQSFKTSCDPEALAAEFGSALPEFTDTSPFGAKEDLRFPLAGNETPDYPNINDDSTFARLNCIVDPASYVVDSVTRVKGTGATSGAAQTVQAISINAGEIVTDGIDVGIDYGYTTDNWGYFGAGLEYTHVRQYTISNVPGLDFGLEGTGNYDAAGTTGGNELVRTLPDNRGHFYLTWTKGAHTLWAANRFVGSYKDNVADVIRRNNVAEIAARVEDQLESYSHWDLHYSYRHSFNSDMINSVVLSVNVLDAFESELPFRELGNIGLQYDGQAPIDPRGRRVEVIARVVF